MKNWFDIAPQGRPFVKMQGLQNHFVIIDGRVEPFKPASDEIKHICNIGHGVGADQLIIIEPVSEHGAGAYARVRIYNTDGTEAEACGNATRCIAKLLMQESGLERLGLEVNFQILPCEKDGDQISVEMGRISFEWDKIPLSQMCDTLHIDIKSGPVSDAVAVNVGNPHLVYFTDDFNAVDLVAVGKDVQQNPLLPHSANIGLAQIIDDTHIKLQVYERPGILTMACGSGACAVVAAARARGLIRSNYAYVQMPGGTLKITYKDNILAIMSGPAEYCYSGHLTN